MSFECKTYLFLLFATAITPTSRWHSWHIFEEAFAVKLFAPGSVPGGLTCGQYYFVNFLTQVTWQDVLKASPTSTPYEERSNSGFARQKRPSEGERGNSTGIEYHVSILVKGQLLDTYNTNTSGTNVKIS
jgi:hypothetical protein